MLKITQEQLEIMEETKLPAFFKTVVEYINKEFPDFQPEQQVDLTTWVTQNYLKAKSYQINTIKGHIKYINYCCLFGDDFDKKYPFANTILTSDKTPNSKMAELKDGFIEELNREES